ncbi:hypothetical protein Q8W13_16280 [Photobacterium damselae subsp. piscicida]|nr:hypothetical protein [Photobacterium damselae subsp. piscicida]
MKYLILLLSLSLLMLNVQGGGGGDDDAAPSSTPSAPATPPADNPPATNPPTDNDLDGLTDGEFADDPSPYKMSDISVDKNYDFTTNYQINTAIDLGGITSQRAFIGLYEEWSNKSGDLVPNPASQLLLQAVDDGLFNQPLTIGKHQTQLLMVVLFMDQV